jgi:hypothetical protein
VVQHFIGLGDIGRMLGVTRQRARQLAEQYDDFPDPAIDLSGAPGWRIGDIEKWIAKHPQRTPGRPKRSR